MMLFFFYRMKTNIQWPIVKHPCRAVRMIIRNVEPGQGNSIFYYLFWGIA